MFSNRDKIECPWAENEKIEGLPNDVRGKIGFTTKIKRTDQVLARVANGFDQNLTPIPYTIKFWGCAAAGLVRRERCTIEDVPKFIMYVLSVGDMLEEGRKSRVCF